MPVLAEVPKYKASIDAAYASDSAVVTACCFCRSCLFAAMAMTIDGQICMSNQDEGLSVKSHCMSSELLQRTNAAMSSSCSSSNKDSFLVLQLVSSAKQNVSDSAPIDASITPNCNIPSAAAPAPRSARV